MNAGVDVFALTAGRAAFESAIPSTVRVLLDGYEPADEVSKHADLCVRRGRNSRFESHSCVEQ